MQQFFIYRTSFLEQAYLQITLLHFSSLCYIYQDFKQVKQVSTSCENLCCYITRFPRKRVRINSEQNLGGRIFEIITRWTVNCLENVFKVKKEINSNRFLACVTVPLTNHPETYRETLHICRLSVTTVSVQWFYVDKSVKFAKLSTRGRIKIAFWFANPKALAFSSSLAKH